MKRILFRVDGNNERGLGDVISLLNIANKLRDFDVLFVSKYLDGINKIKEFGYSFKEISKNASYEDEIKSIKKISEDFKPDVMVICLIIDNYGEYIKDISKMSKTVVIDYYGNMDVYSDVLINWMGMNKNYKYNFLKKDTKYYSGLDYIPLDKKINAYHLLNKKISDRANNILITFGGSDLRNFTLKVMKVIQTFDRIDVTIVIGSAYKNKEELQEFLKNCKCKYNLKENVSNIFELMFNSDLVISTGGLTAFELCAVGTPFISIAAVDHQIDRLKEMNELGICKYAGDWENFNEENLYNLISELIGNRTKRELMVGKGKNLIDGKGVERISTIIKNLTGN